MIYLVEKDKMLQKAGVNVHEDAAKKMRKFKEFEFPRTHNMSNLGKSLRMQQKNKPYKQVQQEGKKKCSF